MQASRRRTDAPMAGRDYWLSIAQSPDPDDLREHILTGFKNGKPFTPYVPTIAAAVAGRPRARLRLRRRPDLSVSANRRAVT